MSDVVAHGDFESAAVHNLSDVGLYAMAEHPETRIWMLSWRLGDGDVQRWHPGDPEPRPLLDHIARGGRFVGHNVAFERIMWNSCLRADPRYTHWPRLEIAQVDCTMSRALALHLPASLDELGVVLGLKEKKDHEGHKLMKKMAKPRKVYTPEEAAKMVMPQSEEWTRRPNAGLIQWWNTPENLAREGAYCDQDVRTETEADKILLPLSADERALWERDQRINDRGVRLDIPMVQRAVAVRDVAMDRAHKRMAELTGGTVRKITESGKLVGWLADRGLPCTSIAKGEHEALQGVARAFGDDAASEVVTLRAEASKTSTAKLDKMLSHACADERGRGLFAYHRAGPGRWGGFAIQPQNLPRVDEEKDLPRVTEALSILEALDGDWNAAHDMIAFRCGDVMSVLSKCLRAMFVAGKNTQLFGADFSNIEGRINAWMADEEWKLQAFRDYDAGTGPDLYKLAYSNTFGVPINEVTPLQRQKGGKTQELALGYQGSVGAWLRFDPDPTIVTALVKERYYGAEPWLKAAEQYDRANGHLGLTADQWIAVKTVVNGWRATNPKITQAWWDRQDAAIEAVSNPETVVSVCNGRVSYLCTEGFLFYRLPSGKLNAYFRPVVREKKDAWLIDDDGNAYPADEFTADEIEMRVAAGAVYRKGQERLQVVYEGASQKAGGARVWGRQALYGGLLCNNDVQGTARELLRFAMGNVEDAGYPVVLHVHDELVSEVSQAFGHVDHYQDLMSILPSWLSGLPLAAKAWTESRYVK